jgi:hypothetical protein
MGKLIDTDELQAYMDSRCSDSVVEFCANSLIATAIANAPTVDATPVIYGKWTITPQAAINYLKAAREYPVAYTKEEQEAYEMAFAALKVVRVAKMNGDEAYV